MQQHSNDKQDRVRLFSAMIDSTSSSRPSSEHEGKVMRLSPDAQFSQTDVARVILDFAASSVHALCNLRLVCRFWNELLGYGRDADDEHALDMLRRAIKAGTLGTDISAESAAQFLESMDFDNVCYCDDVDDDLKEDINENGYFSNTWVVVHQSGKDEANTRPLSGCRVCFVGIEHPRLLDLKRKVVKLGASCVSSVSQFTHGVSVHADYFKDRNARSEGAYIVTPQWVDACFDTGTRCPEADLTKAQEQPARFDQSIGIFTQMEHIDALLANLHSKASLQQMHHFIVRLMQLSSFIQHNKVMLISDSEMPFHPFVFPWDPSRPFGESQEFLDEFKKLIGWKIPYLENHDNITDGIEEINSCRHGFSDNFLYQIIMFQRLAQLAEFLGNDQMTKLPQIPSKDALLASGVVAEDDDEAQLKVDIPIYQIDLAAEAMCVFPRSYVTRSKDGKFLLGVMGIMQWT